MKKKLQNHIPIKKPGIKKLLLTIKLALIIVFLSVLQVSANVYSQITVNLDIREKSVREVLKTIEQQSQIRFFYSDDLLAMNDLIDVKADNKNIISVLNDIFVGSALTYKIYDNNLIVIAPRVLLQQSKITGKVTGKDGTPLIGVNVVVTGTTMGTITDIDGKYGIEVPEASKSLTFTFIGMEPQDIIIGKLTQIDVTMIESAIGLEEVVVVGYGVQKKVNLTGSVSSVSTKELENRPITQASQSLAGLVTGVSVSQGSGRPGLDGSEIRIRGVGTFSNAGKDPLVLIDGLAASINDIDPNNIKSISVLKDAASASIYGNRAANGVILIETKRGEKGKLQVSYNNYVGWQKVTALPQFLDSWEYATMKNVANPNSYTADQIAKYKDGSDHDNYPNVPHLKNLLNS